MVINIYLQCCAVASSVSRNHGGRHLEGFRQPARHRHESRALPEDAADAGPPDRFHRDANPAKVRLQFATTSISFINICLVPFGRL